MRITNLSLAHKTSVFVLLAIIVIGGLVSYRNLPKESFPQIRQPVVYVAASYVGVAPGDMETLVVDPIEDRLQEIAKIKNLTSNSQEGYASVWAEFQTDIEIDEAVRKVREKVDQAAPDLPQDMDEPLVQEINFENIPIMIISIVGDASLVTLKTLAEDLQDPLEEIPGVLSVDISGGLEREVQVNVNPGRLVYYNVSLDDVVEAIAQENRTIPGGSAESGNRKWTVRVPGELETVTELENIVIEAHQGSPIYLRDLAEVTLGFKEQESYSRLNGQPSVTLSIQKRSGENIIQITDRAKEILEEGSADFPPGTRYVVVTDFSEDIRSMIGDLENNIISGLVLVVLVLYFFMGARNGLLVGIAIPISMLLSFIVLSFFGYTLNMIVLFSLILSLGMLVDNAVVIVENIYRQHQEGKELLVAAREATTEVGGAVVASTLTTLGAFLPLVFWDGLIGQFMRYLPITLLVTLSSSLLVGLVFNPVIASTFMQVNPNMNRLPGDRLLRWSGVRYERFLSRTLARKGSRLAVLGITAAAFVLMLLVYGALNHGMEFFPALEPSQAVIEIESPLGTRLQVSDQITRSIEEGLIDVPDKENYVADVGSATGLFDFGSGGGSSHLSDITLDLVDKDDRVQPSLKTIEDIKRVIGVMPGAKIDVSTPEEGPPTGKAVEIQIRGEDFRVLSRIATTIMDRIETVPGISNLEDDYNRGRPELRVQIDREKAALSGLNTVMIANTIRTAVNGTKASEFRVGSDEYDITVRYDRDYRSSYSDILDLTVFFEGIHHPLANFATVDLATGLSSISHVDGDRVTTVSADAIGRSAAEVLAEAKRRLSDLEVPEGYNLSFTGQDEEQRESQDFLMRAFLIAVLLIFFLLVTQFDSVTLPFVIMVTVFLSFFGVFFGLLVTNEPFGIIMTGIGVISLAGVVVNNGIVLIDYIQKLRARGMEKAAAIIQAGRTRLRPVVLTAITTILGLIPLTTGINIDFIGLFRADFANFVRFGAESSDWWRGMGVVVIFGLLFATVLTLLVVPVLYYMFSDLLANLTFVRRRPRPREAVETT